MELRKRERILNAPLYGVIWSISFPLILNNLIQTLYNLADGVWLGQLGKIEFSATAFVWPIIFLFVSFGFGISVAGVSLLSRLIGGKKYKEASDYSNHLFITAGLIALIFSVLGYLFTPHMVAGMGAVEKLYACSVIYLRITFLGYPAVIFFFVFQSMMNAQGDTKSTTVVSGFCMIVNAVLDPFFIFDTIPWFGLKGLHLGIQGAAYATILTQYIMMILGYAVIHFRSKAFNFYFYRFKLQWNKIKKILRIGFPAAIGQSGSALGFLIMNIFITAYGTDVLAAYSMVNRITGLLSQPSMGFGGALTGIVGQNIGADQMPRAKEAFQKTVILSLIFSVTGAVLMYLFRFSVLSFFLKDAGGPVLKEAVTYMIYSIPIIPLMGVFNALIGVFNGSGNTKYSMHMTLGRLWVMRIPMIFIFSKLTSLGSEGIWLSMLLSNLLTVLYGYVLYFFGSWEKKNL